MKHIEQITSEQTIAEIQRLVESDDMLTTALSRPYAAATGLEEVQPLAPITSDVEEMPSWMIYLIRKMFETTTRVFHGVSLLSEFRTVYNWLRKRLKGSEDNYIPSVPLDPSKPMHEHLSLLDSRKIDDGLTLTLTDSTDGSTDGSATTSPTTTSLPDGLSLAQLFCSGLADNITELHDSNKGWTMTKRFSAKTYFPQCEKMELGCEDIDVTFDSKGGTVFGSDVEYNLPNLKVIHPETINVGFGHGVFDCAVQTHDIYMPELERIDDGSNFAIIRGINAPNNTEPFSLYAPKLSSLGSGVSILRRYKACTTGVERIILGTIITALTFNANYGGYMDCPNLVHLEFGQGTKASLNLAGWIPTTALAERLDEFLSNFQTYIADRVADCTGKTALTLTLSAAVYDALQAQEGQAILATLTNKNWTVAQA